MHRFCTILLLLLSGIFPAQEGNLPGLLVQAENVLYSDPQEAVRIAEYVSQKSKEEPQLAEAALLLARGLYLEGHYSQALKIALTADGAQMGNNSTHLKLKVFLSKLFLELELDTLATRYLDQVAVNLNNAKDNDTRYWLKGKILQYGRHKDPYQETDPSFEKLYKAKNKFDKIKQRHGLFQIGNIDLKLAQMHLREFQLDSAQYYLFEALRESRNESPDNYLEMKALTEYGNFLFMVKKHTVAIDTLKSALRIADKFKNKIEQISISEAIASNYLGLNDLKKFNDYSEKANTISNTQGDVENEAVNTVFNFIGLNEANKATRARSIYHQNIVWFAGVFLLLLLLWGILVWRYRSKTAQYRHFISYFEKREKTPPKSIEEKEKTIKTKVVPKEAEEIILSKLADFENSMEFIKKETSLSRLATQFGTNTKYLSETINVHKQKNFNGYINELRINYIIDKLNTDPTYLQYKISYLAQTSGFSSHSVFATVFKSVTGIPPTTFIKILQDKQEGTNG